MNSIQERYIVAYARKAALDMEIERRERDFLERKNRAERTNRNTTL